MKNKTFNILGFAMLFTQGAFIYAKVVGAITWYWWWILSPIITGWALIFFWFLWLCRLIWREKFGEKKGEQI
jgi:hypothetical protein